MTPPDLDSLPLRPRREGVRRPVGSGRVFGIAISALVSIALAGGGGWLLTHQQRVIDQVAVWQFTPDAAISSYAERSTMTDEGRFLFYASRPVIAAKDDFDDYCSSQAEGVGILGCYLHADRRIYLFDVTDDRLDGIEEVVAAHEMLHAAWDRMSDDDHKKLEPLLDAEAAARADDAEFTKRMEFYATAEPDERYNELHSIIGTEFADISPKLESHYDLYFSDRAALIALHVKSNEVFLAQQAAIDDLIKQMDALKAGVDADYASYNAGYDELNADISDFNERAQNGGFSSQRAFTAARDDLLERQQELDALYASITERVTQYDGLVAQLNDLNAQVSELNESINVTPRSETPPS